MGSIASPITSLTIVYSIVYSDADQSKLQRSASLAFVRGIHWGPVNSPHKWPVTRKMFPFDDIIMKLLQSLTCCSQSAWWVSPEHQCELHHPRTSSTDSSPCGIPHWKQACKYHQTSKIRCTWVGNNIVDHSDAVGALPVGAAPTTSSFST